MNLQKYILISFLLFFTFTSFAQEKGKLAVETNFGINANFFVRSYEDFYGPDVYSYSNKNLVGTIGGIDLLYGIGKKSRIGIGYARSRNEKELNFSGQFINVGITQFNISHVNNFYELFYGLDLSKKPALFSTEIGLFYVRPHQQEISIADRPSRGGVLFEERSFKHYKLEEGGAFFGLQLQKKIDTKFYLGIKSRLYYTISTRQFELLSLTPTLSYHFK